MIGTKIESDGSVRILLPLAPYTKKNHQEIHWRRTGGNKRPFVVPSKQYRAYANDCAMFLKDLGIDRPVNVCAHYYMPTRRIVDLNNLHSALMDILVENGLLKDDNSRIVASTDGSRVFYDKENPRTEVLITYLE